MSVDRRVVDAFTELAPRYEETVDRELRQFWGISYQNFVEMLIGYIDLGSAHVALDVATGRGEIPLRLARQAAWHGWMAGLDITPDMLTGAAERVRLAGATERISLAGGSGMRLPFASGSFDLVTCALATHHMQLPALLAELHRVLRPGGQLLVADVALASLWRTPFGRVLLRLLVWWYTRREDPTRSAAEKESLANMRTPEQWQEEVATAGFTASQVSTLPARHRWYPPGILITGRAHR